MWNCKLLSNSQKSQIVQVPSLFFKKDIENTEDKSILLMIICGFCFRTILTELRQYKENDNIIIEKSSELIL